MFTDMVGFTALAQVDERRALSVLASHQRLLRPHFPRHHGREVKTMGDSFLVEFDSALDAVACALAIQRELEEHNGRVAEPEQIRLRIGIHLGDVVHADGDVLGDAVNVASRMEPLAEPGGICVSEPVFGQVRNKVEAAFEKLGPRELKNVQFPLDVYRVVPRPGSPGAVAAADARPAVHRLAVLPFANLSPDPQDEFFADGLTEEMITELARVPRVEVIARTSVMRYKATPKAVKDVGRELNVDLALEGSVRKAANRIRITAQLIDARTEAHLWADRFDRELTDIFAVQTEIARHVADRLGVSLGRTEAATRPPSGNLEAYFLYLRGRALWGRRTAASVRQALRIFEQAAATDPSFAAPYSGIADCLTILSRNLEESPWSETSAKVREAATRAIQLHEGLADAHASLGLAFTHDYAWVEAEREYRRALALDPTYAPAHLWYALLLFTQGRADDWNEHLLRAGELDPFSPVVLLNLGVREMVRGHPDLALRRFDAVAEAEAGFAETVLFYKVALLTGLGRTEEALAAFRPFERSWADASGGLESENGWLPATVFALLGRREEALRSLERLTAIASRGHVPTSGFANIHAALGDADRFFEAALRAADEHELEPRLVRVMPMFDPYRVDPRFAELQQKLHLSPASR